ncbi:Uncharacterized protein APZ42_023935 [Daphnia magna]|uniref:Uncharacterized protein n=1 Tax=Daphnia magna TaxID=35525 RepID=A0A164U9U5_9CRUS|nr:Uncharacterized protein APZ42_023935 [Daphnia magna]
MRADGRGCFVNQSTKFCLIAQTSFLKANHSKRKGRASANRSAREPKSFCYICINRYITQCGLIRFPLKINYNLYYLIRRTTS